MLIGHPIGSPLKSGLPWDPLVGGAPWSPALIASRSFELVGGMDLVQVAGPKISEWGDQEATADYAQSTDANRPGVGSVNSIVCPDFVGGNTRLDGPAMSSLFTVGAGEVWLVANFDSLLNAHIFGDSAETQCYLRTQGTGVQGIASDGAGKATTAIAISTGTSYVLGMWWDSTNLTISANGSTQSVACGALASLSNIARIGQSLDARVAHVVGFNAVLGTNNRTLVKSYLARRYSGTV